VTAEELATKIAAWRERPYIRRKRRRVMITSAPGREREEGVSWLFIGCSRISFLP